MRKIWRCWVLSAVVVCLAGGANAQVDVCKAILSSGEFDTRQDQTKLTNYNHYRSFYCSEAGSSYGSAKSLDATATVPIDDVLAVFGFGANESDYNKWRSELCSSQESLTSSSYWESSQARTASSELLDAFNKCVQQFANGLLQYVSIPSKDSKRFGWTIIYRPDSENSLVEVAPRPSNNVKCDGVKKGKSKFKVGPEGLTLSCSRTNCEEALLVLNGSATPFPATLTIPAVTLPPNPPPPAPHFVTITVPMNRPIADKLPGINMDEKCELVSGVGNWNARPNGNLPKSCGNYPQPSVKGGVAVSDFDSYYLDNSGTCTFTFECRKEVDLPHRVLPSWCSK